MRVVANHPELNGQNAHQAEIDPTTWRNARLRMEKPDGGELLVTLLRPSEWLESHNAEPGNTIRLTFVELGIDGPADVLAIEACPTIETGYGRVVTGSLRNEVREVERDWHMVTADIEKFWSWFISREVDFDGWMTNQATEKVAEEMNATLPVLSTKIGWEIGPGKSKRNFLAFTLGGDLKNIQIVDAILRVAPVLSNWEYRLGRPRRDLSELIFRDRFGNTLPVDLNQWRYVLTDFNNGCFFDVAIATNQRLRIDDEAQQQVLQTAVQSILGEVETLNFVDRIQFVEHPDQEWEERSTPFQYLPEHIDALRSSSK